MKKSVIVPEGDPWVKEVGKVGRVILDLHAKKEMPGVEVETVSVENADVVFVKKEGKLQHVIFPGSKEIPDWIDNFSYEKVLFTNSKSVLVHKGFLRQYELLRPALIERFGTLNEGETAIVCGASLGGALATLTMNEFSDKIYLGCTFGAPKVGDSTFTEQFRKSDRFFRVVVESDPVTEVPAWNGYGHVGQILYYTEDGARLDGSSWLKGVTKIFIDPKEAFSRHKLEVYQRAIESMEAL
jgi:hypothetical protein